MPASQRRAGGGDWNFWAHLHPHADIVVALDAEFAFGEFNSRSETRSRRDDPRGEVGTDPTGAVEVRAVAVRLVVADLAVRVARLDLARFFGVADETLVGLAALCGDEAAKDFASVGGARGPVLEHTFGDVVLELVALNVVRYRLVEEGLELCAKGERVYRRNITTGRTGMLNGALVVGLGHRTLVNVLA
jgi:hypothetical protein